MITECMRRLDQSLGYVETALGSLTEAQLWLRPRPRMNAVGNLCLHIAGSEHQHLVSAIGGLPTRRDRPGELLQSGGYSKKELIALLRNVRQESWSVTLKLTPGDLERCVTVTYPEASGMEGYSWSIQKILIGAVEHYAYHTGQILYASRWLQDEDEHLLAWKHYT
ncbi:DinB family protein [Paenibacillus sp. FSL R7-0345]|uniref:DinB family protein n=1 Tax=Paenibacillus sp. FSL R7-0345 TaxID=2954535 RepID=UPI00315A7EF3